MDALNLQLFQWIAAGHAPNGTLLWLATQLALGASWLSVALMAWAAWRQPADRAYFVAVCLLAAGAGMLAHSLAAALNQPRPFMLGLSPSWLGHGHRGSLPSTHATVMFTVALCFLWRPRLRSIGWVVTALAVLTGWARIYVGVHFPLDVVAGLLLAGLLAGSLAFVDQLARQFLKTARQRSTA
ncbi:phosphatase PAP2 family protein [Variovorax sp. RT4R15]|uniref:phosphatase PAP2 family protein n=1 Tax=Variovorax sp. RT4R15 TaxID=3443737 RepID=UPI003F47252B